VPLLTIARATTNGSAALRLPHQIRIELQYLPDALLYRRIDWAELVASASAHCYAASGDF
jgi:cysteine sulfinate desulfinase/cysteine desulfurase-like protein